jgi:hypothetical protein
MKMIKNKLGDKDVIICDCHSTEHQMVFYYSDDDNIPMVYIHTHLNKKPFWERLKYGIKYIFGYKCRYGAFDEFIFNVDDTHKLQKVVNYLNQIKVS